MSVADDSVHLSPLVLAIPPFGEYGNHPAAHRPRWVEVADHPVAHLTPIGTDFYEPQQIRLNSRPACAIGVPRRSGGVCMAAQKVGQIDRRGDGTWLVRVVVPGIADHRSGIGVEPGTPQSELSRR
jgi:hypothetical protein